MINAKEKSITEEGSRKHMRAEWEVEILARVVGEGLMEKVPLE